MNVITINKMENTEKLSPELKEKWCAALRSGEYKQTTGTLVSLVGKNTGYCCLGVLGHLCGLSDYIMSGNGTLGSDALQGLPALEKIPEFLRPRVISGQPNDPAFAIQDRLVRMNDGTKDEHSNPEGKRKSFKQIADYIEKNL